MSRENVELHYRVLDVFNRRDLDAYLALMDGDVEAVPRASVLEGERSYRGHDGVRRWWKNLLDVFPDYTIEFADEVRDFGDVTFAAIRLRGHGASSTAPTDQAIWIVIRWRRGKCVWWRTFDARVEALKAVGVWEEDLHADSS